MVKIFSIFGTSTLNTSTLHRKNKKNAVFGQKWETENFTFWGNYLLNKAHFFSSKPMFVTLQDVLIIKKYCHMQNLSAENWEFLLLSTWAHQIKSIFPITNPILLHYIIFHNHKYCHMHVVPLASFFHMRSRDQIPLISSHALRRWPRWYRTLISAVLTGP